MTLRQEHLGDVDTFGCSQRALSTFAENMGGNPSCASFLLSDQLRSEGVIRELSSAPSGFWFTMNNSANARIKIEFLLEYRDVSGRSK